MTRLLPVLRHLLLALVVLGLLPGAHELVESVSHVVQHGDLPGSAGHLHGERPDAEHGCTPFAHHCKCCGSQASDLDASAVRLPRRPGPRLEPRARDERGAPRAGPAPELRPPIG